MGADLYIEAINKPLEEKYQKKFDEWLEKRNKAKESSKTQKEAQKKVDYYYDKMYPAEGCFRDSYNDSNLLWRLRLDYWKWLNSYLNENGDLTPAKAKQVLKEVQKRNGLLKDQEQYFKDKYKEFVAFLQKAIKMKSNIECSI